MPTNSWTHRGHVIQVDDNGRFTSVLSDDNKIEAETLAAARAAIDKELLVNPKGKVKLSLKVVGELVHHVSKYSDKRLGMVAHATVIGVNRTTRALQFSGLPDDHILEDVIPDTEASVALLSRLLETRRLLARLEKAKDNLELKVQGFGRIDPEDYEGVVEGLKADFDTAVKRSKS